MGPIKTESKPQCDPDLHKIRKKEKRRKHKVIEEAAEATEAKQDKSLSTVSIAIPGSILDSTQSPELRCYLAGQIARAVCLFQVDEIVIFDDYGPKDNSDDFNVKRQCCTQLERILQYMECPQYLRKHFFPIHKDLKFIGLANPLNAPHHLSRNDRFTYREGVVLNKPPKGGQGSVVNIGMWQDVVVKEILTPAMRCTVKLDLDQVKKKGLRGEIVSPLTPRKETGIYWGYSVRLVDCLSEVFSQCPYENGYDLTVAASHKGDPVDNWDCPTYRHLLIVFGGQRGLEFAVKNDNELHKKDLRSLFHCYLNTVLVEDSRCLKPDETVLVSLSALRPKLNPEVGAKQFDKGVYRYEENVQPEVTVRQPVGKSMDLSRFD